MASLSKRQIAFIQIFITAILWGTTYVLVKIGIEDVGPLTLAGLRYTLAGLILLPFLKKNRIDIREYRTQYWKLVVLGLLAFTFGNGLIGLALKTIPSTTVALLGNLSAPFVLILGIFVLNEIPKPIQLLGVLIVLIGLFSYFSPASFDLRGIGFLYPMASIVIFGIFGIFSRHIARSRKLPFLIQTAIPFLIGGLSLIIAGLIFEKPPIFNLKNIFVILWMAVFNSVIGYSLYNKSIQVLSAFEVNIIQKLAPFSTAFFSFLLLGDRITFRQLISMGIVFSGIYLVQSGGKNKDS